MLDHFRRALPDSDAMPSLRTALWAAALFAAGCAAVVAFEMPIREALMQRAALGALVFFVTSIVAVLVPLASNLPLVPAAVLAWGPGWTALLLLAGWIVGSALSFALGRHARPWVLRHLPHVLQHARIDALIDARHRLLSLVLLRMTFPVDVLSYALGLFSRDTTLAQTALSTAFGGAPFALLFALLPALPPLLQLLLFIASTAIFVAYVRWVRRPRAGTARGAG